MLFANKPTNVTVINASTSTLQISWTLDAPSELPLAVISTSSDFSDYISSMTLAAGQENITYYSLTPNTTYYFKVKVSTEPDEYYSDIISTSTIPNPPSSQSIIGVYFSSITLSWDYSSNSSQTIYQIDYANAFLNLIFNYFV